MSLIYDGSHSMAFIKVNDGGTTVVKRTWEDWHLIPVTNLIVNPPSPSVSFVRMPFSNNFFDASTIPSGNISMGGRSGEWEFYVDHDQWDNWAQTFDEIESFVNGKKLYCVLDDEYGKAYLGRITFLGWKNGDSYSTVRIGYNVGPEPQFNEFDYLEYVGTFLEFNQNGNVIKNTWPLDSVKPYLKIWSEYEGGRQKELQNYTLSGDLRPSGACEITAIIGDIRLTFIVDVIEDGWEVDETNVLDMYPVGSLYISTNSTNPSDLFGGIWEPWGAGRVPVGVDQSNPSYSSSNLTGGSSTHTLTVDEMPAHSHVLQHNSDSGNAISGSDPSGRGAFVRRLPDSGTPSNIGEMTTLETGGGESFSIIQPYITCYMWKRIS